jgi:hypothetical protein
MIRAYRYRRRCRATSPRPRSRHDHCLIQRLLKQARYLGPSVSLLVQALWADALEETARDVQQHLLRISTRYGASRMEAACRRACFYRRTKNCFTIEWILENGYDRLTLNTFTDIRGQFVFPDVTSNDAPVSDSSIGGDGVNILSLHSKVPGSASGCRNSVQSRNARKIKPDYRET